MEDPTDCIDDNTVAALFGGSLSATDLAKIDAHIDSCSSCRVLISRLARRGPEKDAPRDVEVITGPDGTIENREPPLVAAKWTAGMVFDERFEIEEFLRAGGMGEVYRAKDRRTARQVAVKVVQNVSAADLGRFTRESQLLARLSHPAIVTYVAHGEAPDGSPYLAMEWLEGEDLAERLRRGPVTVDETRRLGARVASALAAAHALGIVHRDIKPSNIFLPARDVLRATVLDFGVAFSAPSAGLQATLTRSGTLLGTLAYMAPEQARGAKTADLRADIFSLGCVLYECLTGVRAFGGAHAVEVLAKILADPPPRPKDLSGDVPEDLDRLVVRMMSKDPAERPLDCLQIAGELGGTRTTARIPRTRRWAGFAAVAVAACAIAGGIQWTRARTPAAPASTSAAKAPGKQGHPFHPGRPRRITFDEGCAELPSFTPDARAIVYDATVGAISCIFQRDLESGGPPQQLTHVDGYDMAAAVSPDGSKIAFLRMEGGTRSIAVIDRRPGATPRVLATGAVTRPTWSRDGRSVWTGNDVRLERHDLATGEIVESVPLPSGAIALRAVELSGGRMIAVMPAVHGSAQAGVGVWSADRSLRWLLRGEMDEVLTASPDGLRVLLSRVGPTGENELLDVPLDGTSVVSLATSGVTPRKGFDLSADGRHVAWSTCQAQSRLVAVAADGGVQPMLADWKWDEIDVASIPGTTRAVVLSARAGPRAPWVVDLAQGTAPRAIDVGDLTPIGASVSDDGAWLAFSSFGKGLRVVRIDGSDRARAMTKTDQDFSPSFVHGTHDVLFHTILPDGRVQIRRTSIDGGEATVIFDQRARAPNASPTDDRFIYLAGEKNAELVPTMFEPKSRRSTPISSKLRAGAYSAVRFTPDGRRAVVVQSEPEQVEIDLATGTIVHTIPLEAVALSFVGERTVLASTRWEGDVWLADDPFGE